jgi:hypothetical protein
MPSPVHALIVAHPGHELRVHGWMTQTRPLTFVLTDGSGALGVNRAAATGAILEQAGASIGGVFAALTDAEAYEAILAHDAERFGAFAESIARELADSGVAGVTGDAWEGYNPVHDICRLVIDASVAMASKKTGRAIDNTSFALTGSPDSRAEGVRRYVLDDDAFARKMLAADQYGELAHDVNEAIRDHGREAFRIEVLKPVMAPHWLDRQFLHERPFYERHGEERVGAGKYGAVIRYREHVRQIGEELRKLAESV